MLVRRLWWHVRGYVIIRAYGRRLEALINGAVREGLALWDLERASSALLLGRAFAADYRRLARLGRRLGVRVDVVGKAGLPFWAAKARRRPGLVLGGAVFVGVLYWLAQFVWFVHVDGAQTLPPAAVLEAAAAAGLRPGAPRADVRREDVVRSLHLALPRLAWAAVELRGTVATVRVVERTEADPALTRPGHVVAVRDGLVERVVVTAGEPLVAPGDTVQAGMTLISGALTPGTQAYEERVQAGLPPVVRAAGSVLGRAWYRGYGEARPEDAAADDPAGASLAALTRAAVERARRQARASLPPEARVIDEEVVVVDDRGVEPGVVRAAVTITVLQELGRFSPLAAEEP